MVRVGSIYPINVDETSETLFLLPSFQIRVRRRIYDHITQEANEALQAFATESWDDSEAVPNVNCYEMLTSFESKVDGTAVIHNTTIMKMLTVFVWEVKEVKGVPLDTRCLNPFNSFVGIFRRNLIVHSNDRILKACYVYVMQAPLVHSIR